MTTHIYTRASAADSSHPWAGHARLVFDYWPHCACAVVTNANDTKRRFCPSRGYVCAGGLVTLVTALVPYRFVIACVNRKITPSPEMKVLPVTTYVCSPTDPDDPVWGEAMKEVKRMMVTEAIARI